MKLRRKPGRSPDFQINKFDPADPVRFEECRHARCLGNKHHEPDRAWGRHRIVRFHFPAYGVRARSELDSLKSRHSDLAVDMEWSDIVTAILALAKAAQGEGMNGLTPSTTEIGKTLRAICKLAAKLGIDTSSPSVEGPKKLKRMTADTRELIEEPRVVNLRPVKEPIMEVPLQPEEPEVEFECETDIAWI